MFFDCDTRSQPSNKLSCFVGPIVVHMPYPTANELAEHLQLISTQPLCWLFKLKPSRWRCLRHLHPSSLPGLPPCSHHSDSRRHHVTFFMAKLGPSLYLSDVSVVKFVGSWRETQQCQYPDAPASVAHTFSIPSTVGFHLLSIPQEYCLAISTRST